MPKAFRVRPSVPYFINYIPYCYRNDTAKLEALEKLNGLNWKGKELVAAVGISLSFSFTLLLLVIIRSVVYLNISQ